MPLNARPAEQASASGFRLSDLYYVLFRHKWKILILTTLGVVGGVTAFLTMKPVYVTEARLYIRYVLESRGIASLEEASSMKSPDSRGDNIINSEVDILTSLDLAREVAEIVGPTNIIKDIGNGGDALMAAANVIRMGIDAGAPRKSNVLRVTFSHPDPAISRAVLTNLVSRYLREHTRVHRALDELTDISLLVDRRRTALLLAENDLRKAKEKAGVVNLDEAKKSLFDQKTRLHADILSARATLAEQLAILGSQTNRTAEEIASAATATAASASVAPTNSAPAAPTIPSEKLSEYRNVLGLLDGLVKREQALLAEFTPESQRVKAIRSLQAETEKKRAELEQSTPGLAEAVLNVPAVQRGSTLIAMPGSTLATQGAQDREAAAVQVRALRAKLEILTAELASMEESSKKVADNESDIAKFERLRVNEERQLNTALMALERATLDSSSINQGRLGNINVVQGKGAVNAVRDRQQIVKVAAGLCLGGLGLGLFLAFFLEFYGDQSVRRPIQVERILRVPLFLSIPQLRLNGDRRLLPASTSAGSGSKGATTASASTEANEIAEYAEALRDRLMMHFQVNGLTHKPKLVGVTSCGRGAGTTTVATSLAASLSETGEGNVLYVDVNQDRGPSAHPFRHGQPVVGIRSALEQETRDSARVQDNLYMVSLADPAAGRVGVVPKTLAGLVPKMKASDYDYIIFDLPPITQTSHTSKVAGLLDMTFVVLESGKTQSDLAKKATSLLAESRANMAAVLNKHERYLPGSLDTDL